MAKKILRYFITAFLVLSILSLVSLTSAQEIKSSELALADAAKNGYLVALTHASFPGVGHVQKEGDQFRWVPVPYTYDPNAR